MQKRKMIITHNLDQQLILKIKEVVPDWELIVGRDEALWQDQLHEAEVIAGWKKGMEIDCLSNQSKLKWLQAWSAGVNSMPLAEIQAGGISLTSANGVHSYPISETVLALMLGLTRKIHTYVKNQQANIWHHANLGLEMHEKTLGLIGVGAIGKEIAKISKAFGMRVIGVRHSGKPEEFVDEMYTAKELASILPECDYVVVTLPLTHETHHMFAEEQFKQMKSSAFFINIGRGEIVVEEDLVKALSNGEIAGAGLDVFSKEPLEEDSPLWGMDNVIITPHTSGSTEHYDKRVIEDIFLPNLKTYLTNGAPSINVVDFVKGY